METTATAAHGDAPPRGQDVLVGIAVACLAVFAALLVVVWHVHGPVGLDHTLGYTRPSYAETWRRVALLGSPWFVIPALLIVATAAYAVEDRVAVAVCVLGPALAAIFAELVAKPVVDRVISSALSYPSGHVTLAASLGAVLVFVAYRLGGGRAAAVAAVPAAALAVLESIAVVQIGWHYPTDAIGGIAVGVGVVCAVAAALDKSPESARTS